MDMNPKSPEHEHLKCPRCDSGNTKFCYYNNYNLSQPRHFCKNCRRYWTKGGTLRNIPIGGGTRKITKHHSTNSTKRAWTTTPPPVPAPAKPELEPEDVYRFGNHLPIGKHLPVESGGGYPVGPFGNLLMEGLDFNPAYKENDDNDNSENGGSERGESRCWNGWPDLSIFTPGSSFH